MSQPQYSPLETLSVAMWEQHSTTRSSMCGSCKQLCYIFFFSGAMTFSLFPCTHSVFPWTWKVETRKKWLTFFTTVRWRVLPIHYTRVGSVNKIASFSIYLRPDFQAQEKITAKGAGKFLFGTLEKKQVMPFHFSAMCVKFRWQVEESSSIYTLFSLKYLYFYKQFTLRYSISLVKQGKIQQRRSQ